MKIGVVDSGGEFKHSFFKDKNIIIKNSSVETIPKSGYKYTHAEYICASILKENPNAEIILYNILGNSSKKVGNLLVESIENLLNEKVDIINLSIGIEDICHGELVKVCERAAFENVPIIAAHSNSNSIAYPASINSVLGISSTNIEADEFCIYDEEKNNIIFTKPGASYHQLNDNHIIRGNSFLAAKITGILSMAMELNPNLFYKEHLKIIMKKLINKVPKHNYSKESLYCFSNRIGDELQIAYAEKCLYARVLVDLQDSIRFINSKNYDYFKGSICFIDIDDYLYSKENKALLDLIIKLANKMFHCIIMRYPFYSSLQRIYYFDNYGISIEQFYL